MIARASVGVTLAAVDVAQDVGLAALPAGDHPGQERRSDVADRRGVMLARHGHQSLVARRQCGVEAPGVIGGQEERFAQDGVAPFRRTAVMAGLARRIEGGDQNGERARRRQR
jgi:hypothetical protein